MITPPREGGPVDGDGDAVASRSNAVAADLGRQPCEAASNAIEHAANPDEPLVEVPAEIGDARVTIIVCDRGQWLDATAGSLGGPGWRQLWMLTDTTFAARPQETTVTIRSSPPHGRHPEATHCESGTVSGSPCSCPGMDGA